jgi:hypothetical protein
MSESGVEPSADHSDGRSTGPTVRKSPFGFLPRPRLFAMLLAIYVAWLSGLVWFSMEPGSKRVDSSEAPSEPSESTTRFVPTFEP